MIKVIPIVAALVSANALTHTFFNINIKDFITVKEGLGKQAITFRELFNLGGITDYGSQVSGSSLNDLIMENISNNWMSGAGTLIAAKAVPKMLQKVGLTRQANQLSKSLGLGTVVQL
jgi:hypothetical protein